MNKRIGRNPGPQSYYVPELGIEIKVETVNGSRYCAHFPTGPERVGFSDVHKSGWEHRGPWVEQPQPHLVGE